MRFELELVNGGPIETIPGGEKPPTAPTRKALRMMTDALMDEGKLMTFERMADETCSIMLLVAAALLDHDREPELPDFFEALTAMVESARAVLDRGLMIDSGDTIRCGAVMMELTIRGACASLGMPYDELMRAVEAEQDVRPILERAGLVHALPPEEVSLDA